MFVCTVPNEESYIIHSNYHFREMFEFRVHTQLESKSTNKEEVEIHEIMPVCMQKDHQLAVRTGMGGELYGHGGGPYYF